MRTKSCPNCSRAAAQQATWCLGCRYDFETGETRPVGGTAAQVRGPEFIGAVGDAAGEHETMGRGNYSGWLHVLLAFAFSSGMWGLLLYEAGKKFWGR